MSPMPGQVHVLAVGARTPLGLNALQVAMGLRACLFEPRSTALRDRHEQRIGAHRSPGLPDDLFGFERFVELGAPALRECGQALTRPVPIVLALPDADRPDQRQRCFDLDLIDAITTRAGVSVDRDRSTVVRADNAGFGFALEAACERIAAAGAVLVGGIDSYFHPDVLAWLDEEGRLHSHHSEDGIVPAEGAAFALLAQDGGDPRQVGRGPRGPLAQLRAFETGLEHAIGGPTPNLAATSTAMVRAVLPPQGERCWLLTDWNGERGRRLEWGKVEFRIANEVTALLHDRPVPELGDSGAATGAILLAIACEFWQVGCAPAPNAVIGLLADGPPRAVFALRAAALTAEGPTAAPGARTEAP